jgi:predicted permease
MSFLHDLASRCRSLLGVFAGRSEDRELDDELRFHLEREIEKNRASGMGEGEARRRAHIKLGGVEITRERTRAARGTLGLESLLATFRQALRGLRRSPGYAAAFVLTFGLAVGVNSAVFSVVNGVLLQPLPFQDAERILYVKQAVPGAGLENATFSFIEIDDYRAAATTIDEFVEFGDWEFTVLGEGDPHRGVGGLVTSNYFGVLGMRPALGRLLNDLDDERGAEPVMLLTHAYWERVFGSDPSVVGRVLDLENFDADAPFTPTRVVGVLEPGLHYTGTRQPDFYVNYATNGHYQDAAMRDSRTHRMTHLFARMAPGIALHAAQSELGAIATELHRDFPDAYDPDLGYAIDAVPWEFELTREGRATFLFLMGTVGLILVLAAANVTNLTLTRLIQKEGELSTRAALGASRTDLRLRLTAENALLGLAGGALGVLLAYASRDSLAAYAGRFTVRAQEVAVDWTVLGATLGGGLLLASLLAWLPGLPVAPGVERVASAQSKATDTRVRKHLQRGLVVSQLALSFTLLAGATLLVRSLIELTSVDPGFRTEQILTLQAPTGPGGATLPGSPDPGWEQALDEIRAFAGVRSAAIASWTPLSGQSPGAIRLTVDGEEVGDGVSQRVAVNNVSPGYFETLGLRLVSGRLLDSSDRGETNRVAVVNESMARTYFGGADPLGHQIGINPDYVGVFVGGTFEIVGVVADSKELGMSQPNASTLYLAAPQTTWGPSILVAHQGDAGPLTEHVRDVIHGMQPDRAVENVRTMVSLLEEDTAPSRLNAILFGSFAVLALVIAALGVLGTLAFSVAQRLREFGIRMALGADRGLVLRNVMREGLLLVVLSLALGGAAVLYLGRFLSGFLFGVSPLDPTSLGLAALALGAVALAAAYLPALRATRVDPSEALRGE